jgi:hypothetical protein
MDDLRIKSVAPLGSSGYRLRVEWSDGSKSKVDLTGLIHTSENFKVFADDPAAFRQVSPVHYGTGIGWKNGLDYSAATLKILADEQKSVGGKYLVDFEARWHLNTAETAALFDCAPRTIRAYRKAATLPEPISISLRRFDADPTVFAAHYRPIATRGRGRPRKANG